MNKWLHITPYWACVNPISLLSSFVNVSTDRFWPPKLSALTLYGQLVKQLHKTNRINWLFIWKNASYKIWAIVSLFKRLKKKMRMLRSILTPQKYQSDVMKSNQQQNQLCKQTFLLIRRIFPTVFTKRKQNSQGAYHRHTKTLMFHMTLSDTD